MVLRIQRGALFFSPGSLVISRASDTTNICINIKYAVVRTRNRFQYLEIDSPNTSKFHCTLLQSLFYITRYTDTKTVVRLIVGSEGGSSRILCVEEIFVDCYSNMDDFKGVPFTTSIQYIKETGSVTDFTSDITV